ncbi:hypothetical protein Aduo_008401 [Ancylostoma duodenale]
MRDTAVGVDEVRSVTYNPSQFYSELADLYAKIEEYLGLDSKEYLLLVKEFVKRTSSAHHLRKNVQQVISSELMCVHDRFIQVLSECCQLNAASRFGCRTPATNPKQSEYLPHVSTVNALLVLRSLENGWAAPDPNTGQLLGEAIKTMLADRIDAAAHARKSPFGGEVAARFNFEHSPKNRKHVHGSLHDITTADFFASFSSREHFLGAETNNLLRMKCHANFYERVKSTLHKDISSASNVVVAEEAPSIPLPPLQTTMPEVSVDNKTTCIRPNPEAEIRLTVIICNIATVSANFSQATPKQLPRKIWTRTSYSRAKEDGARGGVAELDADVHSKRDLAKESRRTLQTRAGVAAQYLRHSVEIPSETELGFSLLGSSQSRMRPVKRKMSSESSFEAGGASITEIIPMVSKSTRKSAKLDPHKVTTGVADISPKESFSYTLDGNRAFEQSSSSRLSPIPHDEGEADIRRGRIEPTRVRDRLSLEEDMKMMQSSMSEQQRQKMRGRTSEGFVVTSKKHLSSPPSKAHKTEVPSTSRSRTRRTEGSGSNPHAHKIPSAQAIIEAWRASSFEVLPQESLLTPTQRDSTGKRAFHGIPTTLPVSDSFSLGHSRLGSRRSKVAAQSSALPSKSRDSKEEVNVEVAASTSTDRKAKQRDPVLPSRTVREKTAPQEDIKKRTLRSDSSANSSSEANPVAQATPEVTKVVGHRSRSPQKKNVQLQKVDAISAKEDVVKTTRSSKRDTNIPRVVTFESSPMSSPERMTRRSGSDQNLRRSSARRPQTPTLQPQPSSQRSKTPTQRPQTPAQRPRTPTQHSKAQPRLLESATTEQPPKTSTQRSKTPTQRPRTPTQRPKTPTQRPKTPTQRPRTPSSGLKVNSAKSTVRPSPLETDSKEPKSRLTRSSKDISQNPTSMSSGDDSGSSLLHKVTSTKSGSKAKAEGPSKSERSEKISLRSGSQRKETNERLQSSSPERTDDESFARKSKKVRKARGKAGDDSKFALEIRTSSQSSLDDRAAKIKKSKVRPRKEGKTAAREMSPSKRFTRSQAESSMSEDESKESANERKSSLRRRE